MGRSRAEEIGSHLSPRFFQLLATCMYISIASNSYEAWAQLVFEHEQYDGHRRSYEERSFCCVNTTGGCSILVKLLLIVESVLKKLSLFLLKCLWLSTDAIFVLLSKPITSCMFIRFPDQTLQGDQVIWPAMQNSSNSGGSPTRQPVNTSSMRGGGHPFLGAGTSNPSITLRNPMLSPNKAASTLSKLHPKCSCESQDIIIEIALKTEMSSRSHSDIAELVHLLCRF